MIENEVVTVGTEPTLLNPVPAPEEDVDRRVIFINTGEILVSMGAADVGRDSGWVLEPDEEISFDVEAGEEIYGVVYSGTTTVRVYQAVPL